MQSTNRKRALIVSTSVILLCMTIIAGMTWALFTDTQTVSNHLQAGDLEITLKRIELTKTTLDDDGYLATTPTDTNPVDFTESNNQNVFGIGTEEKIVPGSKFVAKMQIENQSDVAFGYWIDIVCEDEDAAKALAKQLKVTVDTTSGFVGNGLSVGDKDNCIGVVTTGDSATFTVTVEFVDAENNDDAQTQELNFDLVVHAVQATKAPTP